MHIARPAAATRRRVAPTLVAALTAATLVGAAVPASASPVAAAPAEPAASPASPGALPAAGGKRRWLSGAWTGGRLSAARTTRFGTWRGTPTSVAQTYPERGSWRELRNSTWHIDTYRGFRGRLMYGLPLLPSDGSSSLRDVAAGRHDADFRKVARDLASRGRGDAIVRIGWEANGDWYPWQTTADRAGEYRAAFRRVAKIFKGTSRRFVVEFDVSAGFPLRGQSNRLDALTKLYPGDDVVDAIGVDVYDWNATKARTNAEWRRAVAPATTVGIHDVAGFARAHRKKLTVPEWGVVKTGAGGYGDNPFFVTAMHRFFSVNRGLLLAENYFNEPADYLRSSLWSEAPQNPKAAAAYRRLW